MNFERTQIVIYNAQNCDAQVEVRVDGDAVWLNRQQLSLLFGRDVKTIGKHVNNALREELAGIPTVANFATVQTEGARKVERQIEYYNLDTLRSKTTLLPTVTSASPPRSLFIF
jgi:hypothetical protein